LVERYLGIELPKELGPSDWGAFVLTDDQLTYAANDVRHLHGLAEVLRLELCKAGLEPVFKLETDLIPIVVAMEKQGFAVDTTQLRTLEGLTEQRRSELAIALREKFGEPKLNLDSPEQLLGAFDKAGLKLEDTSESTLARVGHELAAFTLQYRQQAKLLSTIRNLRKHVLADGRIHSEFNPLGADTGPIFGQASQSPERYSGRAAELFCSLGPRPAANRDRLQPN
jgi:DNA polymerase I-like protein with 3'-5' exonuclease and polymerase domains